MPCIPTTMSHREEEDKNRLCSNAWRVSNKPLRDHYICKGNCQIYVDFDRKKYSTRYVHN